MNTMMDSGYRLPDALQTKEAAPSSRSDTSAAAFAELGRGVHAALQTYANVHRGSGHNSVVSTHLYEQARGIVLDYLRLDKDRFVVIFCTPRGAELLKAQLDPASYRSVSSQEIGLPLGVWALAVARGALPGGAPRQTGGGTARLVAPGWVVWARTPDKFEAGTPAVVNVIAFAKALQLVQQFGDDLFRGAPAEDLAAAGDSTAARILYHDELAPFSGPELLARLRQTLIGRTLAVPTVEGDKPYINLDNGASTRTFEPIWDAARAAWDQPEQVQQAIVQEVKSICAAALGAPLATYDVIFTSNTTEAINVAAASVRAQARQGSATVVVNTLLEHNSNELPWRTTPGVSLVRLPVDEEGFIDPVALGTLLSAYNQEGRHGGQRVALVAVSGASNVLGACNDLAEISRIVHRHGAQLLVDAAQLVAHRRVNMQEWGIDYLAFSGHKAYAPFGAGVLIARKGLLQFDPAEQALIRSSGEENVGGIAALGKALLLLQRIGLDVIQAEEQVLTARVLRGLAQIDGLQIYGVRSPDAPRFAQKGGVICFNLKEAMAGPVAEELAARGGIGVRAGCHCAHLLIKHLLHIHPLLQQFQGLIVTLFPRLELPGVLRVSLGIENRPEEIDALLAVLGKIGRQPKVDIKRQMDEFAQAAAQNVY